MGIFGNSNNSTGLLKPATELAPWFDGSGIAGKESATTRFSVKGLPLDMYEARNPSSWKAMGNATVQGDDFSQYQIEFWGAAQGEAAGQRPTVKLIRDGTTLYELALENGNMNLYEGKNKMASLDFDEGFFSNTWKLLDSAGKPCLTVNSKSLDHKTEYKNADGQIVARLVSDREIEVASGADSLKVFALYMCQWWYHVNDMCGPTSELAGTPSGLVH
jgi:hypothetical protein